jgi:glucoamylase
LLSQQGSLDFDNTIDVSSVYGAFMFGLHDNANAQMVHKTIDTIAGHLAGQSPSGGCPRYENDHYFESDPAYFGNPWFVTSLWLAQYYVRVNCPEEAIKIVEWTLTHTLPSGVLSEQVNPQDGSPVSVTPLVWSHAELVNTILDLANLD